jgi:hypothetical protein
MPTLLGVMLGRPWRWSSLAVLGILTTACSPGKVENVNRAVIEALGSDWSEAGLTGEFSHPVYPVKVASIPRDTNFTAEVRGPRFGPPGFPGRVAARGSLYFWGGRGEVGPPCRIYSPGYFQLDPMAADKVVWKQTGDYPIGCDISAPQQDVARVDIFFQDASPRASGIAILPWQYTTQGSNIIGTQAAPVGTEVWVQATASSLPDPISYEWRVNGVLLDGVTGSFHATTYTTTGPQEYTVRMVGANGQQVVRTWTVEIVCASGEIFC